MYKSIGSLKNIKFLGVLTLVATLLSTLLYTQLQAAETLDDSIPPQQFEITDQHFVIYRSDGELVGLPELFADLREVTVIFLGELHDDPVAHYLEELILREIWEPGLGLSLEMFESDTQLVLDEYLKDMISEAHLIKSGRAWKNYEIDYRPLVEFAKEHNMPVVAANAPRRYVNMVSRLGPTSLLNLNASAQQFLPPLPYANASPVYTEKFENLMAQFAEQMDVADESEEIIDGLAQNEIEVVTAQEPKPEPEWRLNAQSLWDASMAYSIADTLLNGSATRIVHVNGSFHSAERLGILDHLQIYRPGTSMLVVTMIASESFPDFEPQEILNQGDFIIITDASLPRSYNEDAVD